MAHRILVIDDESDIREIAQVSLELMGGWEVLLASSSQAGLLMAAAEQPDAILLDVMLPDLDGIALFKQLQANPATAQIPIIFLTAKVQTADQRQFANLGVTAIIAKPFDPVTLARQITEILGWE